jgi:hypothetical protein
MVRQQLFSQKILIVLILALLTLGLTGCGRLLAGWRSGSAAGPAVADHQSSSPAACTTKPADPDAGEATINIDETTYTWQGTVSQIETGGRAFLAAVDQEYQKMLGDKAQVGLYADARIVRDDTGAAVKLADIPVGSRVVVTITGGIRESYPVQVSAVEVRVILK